MARKTCAAVSVSPSAVCGRCAGSPRAAAIVERLHVPGSRSPRSMLSSRHRTAVSMIRRGSGHPAFLRNVRSTQLACTTGIRPGIRAASGARASGALGAPARSASRKRWISMEALVDVARGRTRP